MLDYIINTVDSILYSPWGIAAQVLIGIACIGMFVFWLWLHWQVGDYTKYWGEWLFATNPTPPKASEASKAGIIKQWEGIEARMSTNDEAQWKLAILEADGMMDEIIKDMGFRGETMGERMKGIIPSEFPDLDNAWRVHKVRNYIAHSPDYTLKRPVAEATIDIYRRIFRELKVLP